MDKKAFMLKISETDNEAFANDPEAEIVAILRRTADQIENGLKLTGKYQNMRDANGNVVGTYAYK